MRFRLLDELADFDTLYGSTFKIVEVSLRGLRDKQCMYEYLNDNKDIKFPNFETASVVLCIEKRHIVLETSEGLSKDTLTIKEIAGGAEEICSFFAEAYVFKERLIIIDHPF